VTARDFDKPFMHVYAFRELHKHIVANTFFQVPDVEDRKVSNSWSDLQGQISR